MFSGTDSKVHGWILSGTKVIIHSVTYIYYFSNAAALTSGFGRHYLTDEFISKPFELHTSRRKFKSLYIAFIQLVFSPAPRKYGTTKKFPTGSDGEVVRVQGRDLSTFRVPLTCRTRRQKNFGYGAMLAVTPYPI